MIFWNEKLVPIDMPQFFKDFWKVRLWIYGEHNRSCCKVCPQALFNRSCYKAFPQALFNRSCYKVCPQALFSTLVNSEICCLMIIWDKVFKSGLSKFLKAVFHKIYLVHSWILCLILYNQAGSSHIFLVVSRYCFPFSLTFN